MDLAVIFKRLFSGEVCSKPIPLYLRVLDYVISFMWQSCNSERAGSHINQVKTLQRVGLGDDTFNALVFITFNNAPLYFVDTPRLVSNWLREGEGHMSGAPALTRQGAKPAKARALTQVPTYFQVNRPGCWRSAGVGYWSSTVVDNTRKPGTREV